MILLSTMILIMTTIIMITITGFAPRVSFLYNINSPHLRTIKFEIIFKIDSS